MDKKRIESLGSLGIIALIENGHPIRDRCPSDKSLWTIYKDAPPGSTAENRLRKHIVKETKSADFTRVLNFFICAPSESLLRTEMFQILQNRTKSMEERCKVLEHVGDDQENTNLIWDDIITHAKSFEDWAMVRTALSRGRLESAKAVAMMAKLAKTAEEWAMVWHFLPYDSADRLRAMPTIAAVGK